MNSKNIFDLLRVWFKPSKWCSWLYLLYIYLHHIIKKIIEYGVLA